VSAEKKTLAKTEHQLVLGIPPIRRLGPIVIQPQTIVIPIQVEHVRIAVSINYICRAINATARVN